ncbi:MAG: hypothetical protein OER88_07085 [Planctomycetota bacterium]|nr:hypothetical protein [Planctomycetota bacterium]
MAEPEFLICTECESPCYTFDWDDRRAKSLDANCAVCGNDVPETFETEDAWVGDDCIPPATG